MSLLRAIICVLLPPLAVLDKGCGSFILVLALTLCGWVPGVIGAIVVCLLDQSTTERYVFMERKKDDNVIDIEAKNVSPNE